MHVKLPDSTVIQKSTKMDVDYSIRDLNKRLILKNKEAQLSHLKRFFFNVVTVALKQKFISYVCPFHSN